MQSLFTGNVNIQKIKSLWLDKLLFSYLFSVSATLILINYFTDTLGELILFGIFTVIVQTAIFIVVDMVMNHKLIGSLLYLLIIGFAFMCGYLILSTNSEGEYSYDFWLWFSMPQSLADGYDSFKWIVVLAINLVMPDIVYYFTIAKPRKFVLFIVMIIAVGSYAKELATVPKIGIFTMLLFYFMCVLFYNDKKVRFIKSEKIGMKAAVLSCLIAGVVVLIPSPSIKTNRELAEEIFSNTKWAKAISSALDSFSETASSGNFAYEANEKDLFYVSAKEAINLKAASYNFYNYDDDTWSVNSDSNKMDESYLQLYSTPICAYKIYDAVRQACIENPEFCEKYDLYELLDMEPVENYESFKSKITVKNNNFSTQFFLTPTNPIALYDEMGYNQTTVDDTVITDSGEICYNDLSYTSNDMQYTVEYYSQATSQSDEVIALMNKLNIDNIDAFLSELSSYNDDIEISYSSVKARSAEEYYKLTYDENQDIKIKNLADKLTEGLQSDYEKAKAIENYFATGFVYDLDYKKGDENVDDFLFKSKRGVCYEFATAMVLLCREAGLPTRYTSGYALTPEIWDNEQQAYVVTTKQAHAFPEVYISGYGWMAFEPTIAPIADNPNDNAHLTLIRFIQCFLILILIASLILSIIMFDGIKELFFRFRVKLRYEDKKASFIFIHIKSILDMDESVTVTDLNEHIKSEYGTDFTSETILFERAVYGQEGMSKDDADMIFNRYLRLYKIIMEAKKNKKIKKHNHK